MPNILEQLDDSVALVDHIDQCHRLLRMIDQVLAGHDQSNRRVTQVRGAISNTLEQAPMTSVIIPSTTRENS